LGLAPPLFGCYIARAGVRYAEHRVENRGTFEGAESNAGDGGVLFRGLIAHRITNVPGSSAYFLGGAVTYSNSAKESLLGVSNKDIAQHGAVSEQVAQAMADGVRKRFGSTYGVACTGIAGPDGGTPEKPVGLVYIGLAGPDGTHVERCLFEGDRERIKSQTAERALDLLKESVE
jgi:nicotinamide-nucleotide amidase